jgi:hypothetical protein
VAEPFDLFSGAEVEAALGAVGFDPAGFLGQLAGIGPLGHEHHPGAVDLGKTGQVGLGLRAVGRPLANDPNKSEIMELFTHEQYFWPFYRNYIKDHPERMDRTIRFVTERGYKPVFFHEGLMGAPA